MFEDDAVRAMTLRRGGRGTFAFTAEERLVAALGRATYAFMCLRWEALWLYGALKGIDEDDLRIVARSASSLVAMRLQEQAAEALADDRMCAELTTWADAFADCSDTRDDFMRAHPGADSLWSLPTDTPERLTLADRPEDLLDHAHRFEELALEGANLRRAFLGD